MPTSFPNDPPPTQTWELIVGTFVHARSISIYYEKSSKSLTNHPTIIATFFKSNEMWEQILVECFVWGFFTMFLPPNLPL